MSQVEEIAQWIKFLHEVQTLCKSARHGSVFLSIIRLLKGGRQKDSWELLASQFILMGNC